MESSGFIDTRTLPTTGTYTILVDPGDDASGSLTLQLYSVPADVSASITPGGPAVTVTTTTPGQNAALTFAGTAGQKVSVRGTDGMAGQVPTCDVTASLRRPDNSVLAPGTCMETGGFIDVRTLPATGTYTILVDPKSQATGSVTLALYDVPDAVGTLSAGGPATTVSIAAPGQNAALTFAGTAGQRVSLQGTNASLSPVAGCDLKVSVLNPDHSVRAAPTCMEAGGFLDAMSLAATGTYTVVVDGSSTSTGSLTLTLYDVPPDTTGEVAVAGPAAGVALGTPGQNGSLALGGTAGTPVTVRITGNTLGRVALRLTGPDGTELATKTSAASSFKLPAQTLPATGTYTIAIDPAGANTGVLNVSITSP
jgi:hypothetical protein